MRLFQWHRPNYGELQTEDHVPCSWATEALGSQKPWRPGEKQSKSVENDGVLQQRTHRKDLYNHHSLVFQEETPDSPRACEPSGKEMQGAWYPEINEHLQFLSQRAFFHNIFIELYQTSCYATWNGFRPCIKPNLYDPIITFVFKDGLFSCRFMFRYA